MRIFGKIEQIRNLGGVKIKDRTFVIRRIFLTERSSIWMLLLNFQNSNCLKFLEVLEIYVIVLCWFRIL